jgi:hypothetical protein
MKPADTCLPRQLSQRNSFTDMRIDVGTHAPERAAGQPTPEPNHPVGGSTGIVIVGQQPEWWPVDVMP